MEASITFISLFATIFGISYYFLYTRNKERLALIEAGADVSLFQAPPTKRKRHPAYSIALVIGLMAMGIGLGVIFAFLLDYSLELGYKNQSAYIAGIFFFGGLGLVTSFLLLRWLDKKDEEKK